MAEGGMLGKLAELKCSFALDGTDITIGVDLGDKFSHCCLLDASGYVLTEGRIRTTPDGFKKHFEQMPRTRIAIEVGTHSRWISQLLETKHDSECVELVVNRACRVVAGHLTRLDYLLRSLLQISTLSYISQSGPMFSELGDGEIQTFETASAKGRALGQKDSFKRSTAICSLAIAASSGDWTIRAG